MDNQSQNSELDYEEKITQLEAELEQAYIIIERLTLENHQLRNSHINEISDSYTKDKLPIIRFLEMPKYRQKKRTILNVHQDSLNKLSQPQFIALVIAVAASFVAIGVNLFSLYNKNVKKISVQPSLSPSPSPSPIIITPSIAPLIPTPLPKWAIKNSLSVPFIKPGVNSLEVSYNMKTPPTLQRSQKLQAIVDEVVGIASAKGLPKKPLSITLINATTGEFAEYQQDVLRYPASVVKMFWMVALYAQIERGIWQYEADFNPYIAKMIVDSDNEAASFVVDQITHAQSLPELNSKEYEEWLYKREFVTRFFREADYKDINISQKTFPIPYINLLTPQGTELQLRRNPNSNNLPIRNKISTEHAARLLYEVCYLKQGVSQEASAKMCGWLKRDLNPKVWKKEPPDPNEFNPIRNFFGQSLVDANINFYSKAGWTSGSRQEAAVIETSDGRDVYILAIFGDDKAYAQDEKIFPKMSRLVYDRMKNYR